MPRRAPERALSVLGGKGITGGVRQDEGEELRSERSRGAVTRSGVEAEKGTRMGTGAVERREGGDGCGGRYIDR